MDTSVTAAAERDAAAPWPDLARRREVELRAPGVGGTADVTGFVRRQRARRGVASTKATATGLRSLLRFLFPDGQITASLTGAVPSAACWPVRGTAPGRQPGGAGPADGQLRPDSVVGRWDLAILVLLARLGLRAGEVAALGAEGDISWRQGEITGAGKGSRVTACRCPPTQARRWPTTRTYARPSWGCWAGARGAAAAAGASPRSTRPSATASRSNFPSPVREDGPGWQAEVDFPHGATVTQMIDRCEQLASGPRRPLGAAWPESAAQEHAGGSSCGSAREIAATE